LDRTAPNAFAFGGSGRERMKARIRSANRRAILAWRRLRAGLVDTRVSRAGLAAALGVAESEVSTKVAAIRRALATRLPAGPQDAAAICETLTADAPDELPRMISQADKIREHTFDLLGSGPVHLGARIDWHRDFKSGYRWNSSTHYAAIRFGEKRGVDVKVPWELSRGQHLPLLAQTYLLTGTREYAREAVNQILDWIETNPPELGVNWACPMDAAIRAVNWLWTAALLSQTSEADEEFFEQLLASLFAHGNYLHGNLEVMPDGIRTNHYIADLVGLLYLGLCLPELDGAGEWAAFARTELASEIERQVLPDGVSYESSIGYHRLVGEMFVSAALLARHRGAAFETAFTHRLAQMIDFTAAYLKPNGLAPQVGDADDGRLHVLTGYGSVDPRDHRHLLAAGAVLFGRNDWYVLSSERWTEALWVGGARTHRRPPMRIIERASASFEHGGFYILRNDDDFVMLTAGGPGTGGLSNHKHNDLLAIEIHLAGEDVLVDPGSYLYTSDPAARDAFRSTHAHNTVMVDGVEQNRIPTASLFSLHCDAWPRLVSWEPTHEGGSVIAEHDGYARLGGGLIHRRSVRLESPHALHIEDRFIQPAAAAWHEFSWTFAFAARCDFVADEAGWLITTPTGRILRLAWPYDERAQRLNVDVEPVAGSVAPRYGVRQSAPVLRWRCRGLAAQAVRFSLQAVASPPRRF
jgi:hypothetical protein